MPLPRVPRPLPVNMMQRALIQYAAEATAALMATMQNNDMFVPSVELDTSQVRDLRGVEGPVDMRNPMGSTPPPPRPPMRRAPYTRSGRWAEQTGYRPNIK